MDTASCYSAGLFCTELTLSSAIRVLENIWFCPFWVTFSVQGDRAFAHDELISFLLAHGSSFRPVLPRRHGTNVLESKHGVICSIFSSLPISILLSKPRLPSSKPFSSQRPLCVSPSQNLRACEWILSPTWSSPACSTARYFRC